MTAANDRALARSWRLAGRHSTGVATVKRHHTLRAGASQLASSLAAKAGALAGASSITLGPASGSLLAGEVPKGIALTIAGTEHKTTATAKAQEGQVAFSIDPALPGALTIGDAVAIAASSSYEFPRAVCRDPQAETLESTVAAATEFEVVIPRQQAVTIPAQGDTLEAAGKQGVVVAANAKPGEWVVQVGGSP